MSISAGTTYELLPVEDVTLACEVQGNAVANKANVRLYSRNGSNAQKWQFVASGTSGVWYLVDAETGKACEVFGGTSNDEDGANVSMYTANQTVAQQWQAIAAGTQAINGTSYECYQLVAFGGTTSTARCMDVQGDGSYVRSNIQIWKRVVGHPSQTFALFPTEWNAIGGTGNDQAVLPTPSNGACGTAAGVPLGEAAAVSSGTLYPAWACDAALYQVRYRTRTRAAAGTALSDWSDWRSISGSGTGYDGFGQPGASNCTPTAIDGLLWASQGVSIDNSSTYDRTDVQFTARAWTGSWGTGAQATAHGGEYTWERSTVRPVSVSSASLTFSPAGLVAAWASDATRGGGSVAISSPLFGTVTGEWAANGSLTVPMPQLDHVPGDGESVDVALSATTADGLAVSWSGAVAVSYGGGYGETLALSATVDGSIATVTASLAGCEAWLLVPRGHGDRFVPLGQGQSWRVPAPLGVPWRVFAAHDGGSTWSCASQEFAAIPADGYHITSQDLSRDLCVSVGSGDPPTFSASYSRDYTTAAAEGRERPIVSPRSDTAAQWTLDGMLYGDGLEDGTELADWAAHAGHVYFRDPRGFWAQAFCKSASVNRTHGGFRKVSFGFNEEIW